MKHKKKSTPGKKKSIPGMSRRNVSLTVIALLLAGLGLATTMLARAPARHAPSATDGRYDFRGVVKSVDKAHKRATIKHEKVGDLMDAMTMPFVIKDEQALNEMEPGDQIKAVLVSTDDGGQWLEQITFIARANNAATGQVESGPEAKPLIQIVDKRSECFLSIGKAGQHRDQRRAAFGSSSKEVNKHS
jgi:Cu/Ag efflux protein CusF